MAETQEQTTFDVKSATGEVVKVPRLKIESSSQVAAVGYYEVEQRLFIEFHNHSVYAYENVDTNTAVELVTDESVGSYFDRKIKKNPEEHPWKQVQAPRVVKK